MRDCAKHAGKYDSSPLLQIDVTILQQINGNSLQSCWKAFRGAHGRPPARINSKSDQRKSLSNARCAQARCGDLLAQAAMRCVSRDTLRCAALRCTTFFCAARMITGSASAIAASARRTIAGADRLFDFAHRVRRRERRALLTTVRRTAWRAAFLADFVLAMIDTGLCEAALIGDAGRSRQRFLFGPREGPKGAHRRAAKPRPTRPDNGCAPPFTAI